MNGGLRTVDSVDGNGNWATYIVGTAQSGALHYDLKLTSCGSSTSACTANISNVWLDSQSGATSPPASAPQAPVIWWDANGVAYAYYFTKSGSTSYINVMRLYDGTTSKASLSFTPSSTATVDVLGGKLYVGDAGGNVWSFDLTAGTTAKSLTATQIGTVANALSAGPVRYVGIGQTSNGYYIWATTDHEVNAFKFTGGSVLANTSGWTLWWWSATNGSGYFNGATMTTTTIDPGVTSTTAPYWLDTNGTITDASVIENNTLVVPVTVSNSTNSCGPSIAKYDFFNLDSGVFPQNRFYLQNGNVLTSNPIVGYGTAFSPVISENSNGSGVIYGSAQQNPQQQIGFQVAATTGIHVGSGVMGWQPLWMTQP
jgi:type IV pilus assembly protein PilY1